MLAILRILYCLSVHWVIGILHVNLTSAAYVHPTLECLVLQKPFGLLLIYAYTRYVSGSGDEGSVAF